MGLFSGVKKIGKGLIGGLTGMGGADAAMQGADAQERYLREGLNALDTSYTNQLGLLKPSLDIGNNALTSYNALLGLGGSAPDYSGFMNSPDYNFALEQGQLGLDRTAAAGGNLFSGGRMKEASRFNQGLATQNYQNYANRLAALANLGPQVAGQLAGYQGALGQNKASLLGGIGDAKASGYAGQANSYGNAVSNALNFASSFVPFGPGANTRGYGGTGSTPWDLSF